jgi:hypothetical protein
MQEAAWARGKEGARRMRSGQLRPRRGTAKGEISTGRGTEKEHQSEGAGRERRGERVVAALHGRELAVEGREGKERGKCKEEREEREEREVREERGRRRACMGASSPWKGPSFM